MMDRLRDGRPVDARLGIIVETRSFAVVKTFSELSSPNLCRA
jgi:hypothetical protein